jgi:hypothetical protein
VVTAGDTVLLFEFWGIDASKSDSLLLAVAIDPERIAVVNRTFDHRASPSVGDGLGGKVLTGSDE